MKMIYENTDIWMSKVVAKLEIHKSVVNDDQFLPSMTYQSCRKLEVQNWCHRWRTPATSLSKLTCEAELVEGGQGSVPAFAAPAGNVGATDITYWPRDGCGRRRAASGGFNTSTHRVSIRVVCSPFQTIPTHKVSLGRHLRISP